MTTEAATIASCDNCNGDLVFEAYAGLPEVDLMNGFAWCAMDTSDLWKVEVRGDDRVISGLPGVRAYPRERHSVTMQFPLVIVGAYDRLGVVNIDAREGLAENLAYLRANLELPLSTGDGTRPVTWTREDGVILEANAHVIPPLQHAIVTGSLCRAVLTINVPTGLFTPTGS